MTERNVNELRELGRPSAGPVKAPKRAGGGRDLAERAKGVLDEEFRKALELKGKLAAEAAVGGKEKGRAATRQAEKLRSLVASLEGMSRFAIAMGILTPAENRALWQDAISKGLYEGWR